MHGQAGRRRAASATASPMWSPWPWVTSSRSSCCCVSAVRGLMGLPSHGSNRMTLPPGVRTSTAAWPSHVNEVSRPIAIRAASCRRQPAVACAGTDDRSMRPRAGPAREGRLHSARCPRSRSPRTSSLINWTVLTGLAVGSFVLVALARLRTAATKGYLALHGAVRRRVRGAGVPLGHRACRSSSRDRRSRPTRPTTPRGARPSSCSSSSPSSRRSCSRAADARWSRAWPALAAGLAVLVLGGLTWGGAPGGRGDAHGPVRRAGPRDRAASSPR